MNDKRNGEKSPSKSRPIPPKRARARAKPSLKVDRDTPTEPDPPFARVTDGSDEWAQVVSASWGDRLDVTVQGNSLHAMAEAVRRLDIRDPFKVHGKQPSPFAAWDGPFTVRSNDHAAAVLDSTGATFATVSVYTTTDIMGAKARATRIAEALNRGHDGRQADQSNLEKDVTRFLLHPSCRVSHGSLSFDLQVVDVKLAGGELLCTCRDPATPDAPTFLFPFATLFPGGPISEAMNAMARLVVSRFIDNMTAQLAADPAMAKEAGLEPIAYLRDVDGTGSLHPCAEGDPGAFPVFGKRPADTASGFTSDGSVTVTAEDVDKLSGDRHRIEHCNGCDVPEDQRMNLPEGWKPGDIVPSGLTIHGELETLRRFVFVGDPRNRNRLYFDGPYPKQVHHLQVHSEYVIQPGSPHAEPTKDE